MTNQTLTPIVAARLERFTKWAEARDPECSRDWLVNVLKRWLEVHGDNLNLTEADCNAVQTWLASNQ